MTDVPEMPEVGREKGEEDRAFVLGLPDRVRLYAKLYPTVEIKLNAAAARLMADDLERGIAHRPENRVAGKTPDVAPPKSGFLQRVARLLLTKNQ